MRANLVLVRDIYLPKCIFGSLYLQEEFLCYTLELPYYSNKKGVSSIPVGLYKCRWRDSPKFGRSIELLNVPNRKYILIHIGNKPSDTQGCILVGEERFPNDNMLLLSKRARDNLHKSLIPYREVYIEVIGEDKFLSPPVLVGAKKVFP